MVSAPELNGIRRKQEKNAKIYKGWLSILIVKNHGLVIKQARKRRLRYSTLQGKSIREIAELAHMSFRDIGAITNKVKSQADRERGYVVEDAQPKSPESKAFKLFFEGKSPIEVAIALDEPGDRVRYMHREYLELTGRHRLAQIYDEAKYDLWNLLRLHEIVNDLGMEEQEIINVLKLANGNDLPYLQSKVDYLRNQQNILTNKIDRLKGTINMYDSALNQKKRRDRGFESGIDEVAQVH